MAIKYTPVLQPVSMKDDPQVKRTRKILLIIVGICLALSVFNLVGVVFGIGTPSEIKQNKFIVQISQCVLSTLFYGLGFFVAYRYSTIGLRIFACWGIIYLVLLGTAIGLLLLAAIIMLIAKNSDDKRPYGGYTTVLSALAFIVVILCVLVFILILHTVKLSFKLARLVEAKNHAAIQHA